MKRLLKEPLLHFLALGALLFVAHSVMNRDGESGDAQILVTQGKIENLQASFSRVWQRPPSPAELDGLIQDYVREEVLMREAMALGLDRDDTVIRRRLRQKMEFLANDLAAPAEPGEEELKEFLAKHPDRFRLESRFTFRQIYLNPDRRGDGLKPEAERLLSELNQPGASRDFRNLGDVTLLNPELAEAAASEVTSLFGEEFTRQLAELPEGRWHGPVPSCFGVHLVYLEELKPGRMPELAEIREQVAREWTEARRRDSNEQFYHNLLKRYAVTIELPSSAAQTNTVAVEARR
jgi:hypothetical protein